LVRRAFELGATTMLEPSGKVMPSSREAGVWTTHGDLALPLLATDRELAAGDVLWTDISITYAGYCSDFGRTWVVGEHPTTRQQDQFRQWRAILDAVLAVTKAGATSGISRVRRSRPTVAASRGCRTSTWATASAPTQPKAPMIGTDLGAEFDDDFVFPPGMVLVLEPVCGRTDRRLPQ